MKNITNLCVFIFFSKELSGIRLPFVQFLYFSNASFSKPCALKKLQESEHCCKPARVYYETNYYDTYVKSLTFIYLTAASGYLKLYCNFTSKT